MLSYTTYHLNSKGIEPISVVCWVVFVSFTIFGLMLTEWIFLIQIVRQQNPRHKNLTRNVQRARPVFGYWSGFV